MASSWHLSSFGQSFLNTSTSLKTFLQKLRYLDTRCVKVFENSCLKCCKCFQLTTFASVYYMSCYDIHWYEYARRLWEVAMQNISSKTRIIFLQILHIVFIICFWEVQSLWNDIRSTAVILSYSVHNFKTILHRNRYYMRTRNSREF